jgi:hypothetical protein
MVKTNWHKPTTDFMSGLLTDMSGDFLVHYMPPPPARLCYLEDNSAVKKKDPAAEEADAYGALAPQEAEEPGQDGAYGSQH